MTASCVAVRLCGVYKDYVPPLSLKKILKFRFTREHIRAVCGVDMELEAAKVHAIVGPNGAGKTTLLQLVCGLLWPTRGRIEVFGLDPQKDAAKVKSLVGYCITEARSFFLRLSGRENLRFFAALYGLGGSKGEARIRELLEQFELQEVADRTVLTYSEGMKQRLSIARALLHRPRLLLLDEVSRGLDPRLREKVLRHMKECLVQREGTTVLMASHNLDEVRELADRVYVMEKGKIVASGSFEAIEPTVKSVFFDGRG